MSIFFTSLNSGSNGNCYYVGNKQQAILIDAGLLCNETEKRMANLNLSMLNVKAIFITHEHSDHVKGIPSLYKKYKIPIYITDKTKAKCKSLYTIDTINFETDDVITIGDFEIKSFLKFHDAVHPHSFTITCNKYVLGVFTDIGTVCENLQKHFATCHAAILEANYDEQMLANGKYPDFLKDRISGSHGHLSNAQALELFVNYKAPYLSTLMLGHLSKDNNDVQLVQELFSKHANDTQIIIASRYNETEIYCTNSNLSNNEKDFIEKYYQAKLF
jgi:phosphoribosyl 1,2-cyclic phosphodiesterase